MKVVNTGLRQQSTRLQHNTIGQWSCPGGVVMPHEIFWMVVHNNHISLIAYDIITHHNNMDDWFTHWPIPLTPHHYYTIPWSTVVLLSMRYASPTWHVYIFARSELGINPSVCFFYIIAPPTVWQSTRFFAKNHDPAIYVVVALFGLDNHQMDRAGYGDVCSWFRQIDSSSSMYWKWKTCYS